MEAPKILDGSSMSRIWRPHVKEVVYCDLDLTTHIYASGWRATSARTSAIPELASSLSRIHQLPRHEAVNLTFFLAYGEMLGSDTGGRFALQAEILGALAASFSFHALTKLIPLSLDNLRTWDVSPSILPHFRLDLRTLRPPQLSVIYDGAQDRAIVSNRWLHF